MTRDQPPSEAIYIKQAVSSADTCSEATVQGLKRLLESETRQKEAANEKYKKVKALKVPAGPTRPTTKRSKLRSVVEVVEVHEDVEEGLELRDKVKLATEVVNATLKSLTNAIKAPVQSKPLKRSSLSRAPSGQSSRSSTPLRARCVNQQTGTPNTLKERCVSRLSSSLNCNGSDQGVLALATCAREALAFLRKCCAQTTFPIQLSPAQVESGMSALVNKLIALGLDDIATKELRILLTRLGATQEDRPSKGLASIPKQQTMCDLLIVKKLPQDSARLALLATSHLQVLRIIARKKRPVTIEAALKHLKLSNPCSPINLVYRTPSHQSTMDAEKVARQLESFAQVLQSLVPTLPKDRENTPRDSHSTIAPYSVVEYQLLVLGVRTMWWRMVGHQADTRKEFLVPFSSAMLLFNRRSSWSPLQKHEFCVSACARFLDLLEWPNHDRSQAHPLCETQSIKCDVFQIMADSACNTLRYNDAQNYLERCLEISKALGQSQTSVCSVLCQIISVQLKDDAVSKESTCSFLGTLVKALRSDLLGESAELDSLLLRTVQLQRLVVITLFGAQKVIDANSTTGPLDRLESTGLDYILEYPLFLKRYLGKRPGSATGIRQTTRYTERRLLAGKVALPAAESLVGLARTLCTAEARTWQRVDSSLSTCISVMTELESAEESASSQTSLGPCIQQGWRQLISGVYWCRFLRLKQQSAPREDLLQILLASIALLDKCSPSDQLQNQICIRLDQLGSLYESTKNWTKAAAIYSRSLNAQVTADCMVLAATSMSTKPLATVLHERPELETWNRTILSFSRVTLKVSSTSGQCRAYDRTDLPTSLRGMVLEQQVASLELSMLNGGSSQILKSTLNNLAYKLLDIYEANRYPIRRTRVILAFLCAELTSPSILLDEVRERISKNPLPLLPECLEEDSGLSGYACHLEASHELVSSFLQETPSVALSRKVLDAWKSVMEASRGISLRERVDSIPCWTKQLRMLADFFGMQGLEVERAETLEICQMVQGSKASASADDLARCQTDLSFQLLDFGQSREANLMLQKVKKQVDTVGLKQTTKFQWHLASASYSLQVDNAAEWQSHLLKAKSLLIPDADSINLGISTTAKLTQLLQRALLSFVQAMHALSRVSTGEAIFHARWAAKLSYRAWALLEHKVNRAKTKDVQAGVSTVSMVDSIAALSLNDTRTPTISSTKHESLNGSAFWFLVPFLIQRLLFLASLFENSGLVAEAQYYIDQATKIADAVRAPFLQSQCLAAAGVLALRRSKLATSLELLMTSLGKARECQNTLFHARLHIWLHEAHVLNHDWQKASSSLNDAESVIEGVQSYSAVIKPLARSDSTTIQTEIDESLASRLETITLATQKGPRVKGKKLQKPILRSKRTETVLMSESEGNRVNLDMLPLLRLKGEVKRRHAFQALMQKDIKNAMVLLSEAAQSPQNQDEVARQAIGQAQAHLLQGFAILASNSVFCILHESSISYPSMLQENLSEYETVGTASPPKKAAKTTRTTSKPPGKTIAQRSTESSPAISNFFRQAFDRLKHLVLQSSPIASSRAAHAISDRLVKSSLLSSATSCTSSPFRLSPSLALYSLELGRCTSAAQELSATQAEKLIAQEGASSGSKSVTYEDTSLGLSSPHIDYATFQREFIDIIPENWTVISISISENLDELRLSKLCWRQKPFIVMIPLNRHNSRDTDEGIFNFEQGRAELTDIIELANYSTHDERDFSKKGAKTEWWEARAALDARLQDLLVNIENIWLGGFRGFFGQRHWHRHLLSRFQESFDRILNTHVPSRRRTGRVGKNDIASRVELDPQVLELVVGLGNPNDFDDLDEPLLDLLYFVIDILQFHGERNAYDEIDFDLMIVETLDALRQYHQSLLQESQNEPPIHTILILDKAVHAFPWESLPCLKGQPVTRLPSLVHLRSRILEMRQQGFSSNSDQLAGLHVDSHNAGYILNPSADLAYTESTFVSHLTSLPSKSESPIQILGRSPSASEFETALTSHSLLLYFGHGSGGQYIRSRTIQKLDHCAVALLLGCSSAKLVEEGEYEPHGMINSYLAAGAPAVVGTLWDVTDKDIDRWSLDCLKRWGLFEEEEKGRPLPESPTKKPRGRGKGKKALDVGTTTQRRTKSKLRSLDDGGDAEELRGGETKGKVSLDQAAALARDKCLMKYLNGAAPVVYGIPVYLS